MRHFRLAVKPRFLLRLNFFITNSNPGAAWTCPTLPCLLLSSPASQREPNYSKMLALLARGL
jgi:hypothetical protein